MQDLQQLREDLVPRLVEHNALGAEDRVEQQRGGRVVGPLLEVEQLFLVLQPDEADALLRVVSSAVSGASSGQRGTKRASSERRATSDESGESRTWVMYMLACWMMNALLGSSFTSSIPWLYCGNPEASQSSGT